MRTYEDFPIGHKIVSQARTLTETHVVQFAMLTGDWNRLHSDAQWSETDGPFGRRIAHGYLVLSFASGLISVDDWAVVSFYGIDRLRFVKPTFIGDTLHVTMETVAREEREPHGGLVTLENVVADQDDVTKAVYATKVLLAKRDAGQN